MFIWQRQRTLRRKQVDLQGIYSRWSLHSSGWTSGVSKLWPGCPSSASSRTSPATPATPAHAWGVTLQLKCLSGVCCCHFAHRSGALARVGGGSLDFVLWFGVVAVQGVSVGRDGVVALWADGWHGHTWWSQGEETKTFSGLDGCDFKRKSS